MTVQYVAIVSKACGFNCLYQNGTLVLVRSLFILPCM